VDIPRVIEDVLTEMAVVEADALETILAADADARHLAHLKCGQSRQLVGGTA
jgi:1-deoxy-D-xylulose 5-phosphate reductoisomerase